MRELFRGFYRPSDQEFEELWHSGLVVPDANVLLTLYRISRAAREQVYDLLERLGDRLWIPHRVAYEFQLRRAGVIEEQQQAYDRVDEELDSFAKNLRESLRLRHPRIDRDELLERVGSALQPIRDYVAELREGHPDPLSDGDPLGADAVRDALDRIVGDKVGKPIDEDHLVKEGKRRYERKIPPGYEDAKKPEPDRYGDLAIWLEILAKAEESGSGVIFVTEDVKEDWWLVRHGKTIGPRPELVQEMRATTDKQLYLYRFEPFLERASTELGVDLEEATRGEVRRARDAQREAEREAAVARNVSADYTIHLDPDPSYGWTQADLTENLGRYALWPGVRKVWRHLPSPPHEPASVVTLLDDAAVLTLGWQGGGPLQVACEVTTPDGETTRATATTNVGSVSVSYPSDFPDAKPLAPGRYEYVWRTAMGGSISHILTSGEFEVSS